MQRCSVIIVSYQSGPILFATLRRVLAQEGLAEIILVDNGNAPHTLSRLQQMTLNEPRLRIVSGHGNVGVARGSNIGAAKATGDYLLFLHPDCLLSPAALVRTMDAMVAMPEAMVAGAWVLKADGSEEISSHPRWIFPGVALRHMLRFSYPYRPTSYVPGGAFEVTAVGGAFLCISRKNFDILSGFDEHFFLCVADVDLCRRVLNAGKKVIKLPQVQVVHIHSTTGQRFSPYVEWQNTLGLMHYYKKHDRTAFFPGGRWGMNALLGLHYVYLYLLAKACGWFPVCKAKAGLRLRARLLQFFALGLADIAESRVLHERQVLLTGATGQVGACVLRRLVAAGASVVALTRQEPLPYFHENIWWVKGDLSDEGFALPDIRLDAVVHCAPLMHLPRHLPRLATMGVTRVVAFGTTSLFSRASSKNWHEKKLVDDLRAAETAIEAVSAQEKMRWTILRPTLIYGMEMDNGITRITRFIRRFRFFPVYPPAQGKRHPVHADDLAMAALQVMDNAATYGKSYNLSGADVMTFRQMLERIFEACGRKKRVVETTFLPFGLDLAGKLLHKKEINAEIAYRMNDDLIFFHENAAQDFGFSPRGFLREGGN